MTTPWLAVAARSPTWPTGATPVMAAVESARAALSRLGDPRAFRDPAGRVAAAASIRAARASAALEGVPLALDPHARTVSDPVLAGAVRVAAALGPLGETWQRAPLQVLARLHTLAAADVARPDALGRPRIDAHRPELVSGHLAALAELVVRSPWPAPVLVAVVHGELLSLAPFGSVDGVVARAAARLTMITTGLDQSGSALPEVAHLGGAAAYRSGARSYADGGRAGLEDWVILVCRALARGAAEGRALAAASV